MNLLTRGMRTEKASGDDASGPAPTTPGFTPITTVGPKGVQYFDAEGNQLKRPRGRPRKDGSWPQANPNPKPPSLKGRHYIPSRVSSRQRGEAPEDPSAYVSSSFIGEDGEPYQERGASQVKPMCSPSLPREVKRYSLKYGRHTSLRGASPRTTQPRRCWACPLLVLISLERSVLQALTLC